MVFTRGAARLLADRLVYQRRDGRFTAENIRLGSPPYFAEGALAEGTPKEITIRQARVSYGEPGPWQPTFTADTVVFAPGEQVRTERASAGIGHTQPLPAKVKIAFRLEADEWQGARRVRFLVEGAEL